MKPTPLRLTALVAAIALAASFGASAALTDLSQTPLASSASNLVKPNISYVLDTSGSMAWSHAPDESQPWYNNVGYKTSQCNSIYYNPNILYPPARNYDGTQMANSSFTAAPKDGFASFDGTSTATVNLSTSYYAYDNSSSSGGGTDTLQPAYYYSYVGNQQATGLNYQNTSSQFYQECNLNESHQPYATIKFSGSSATSVTGITVGGTQIMSGATSAYTSSSSLASATAGLITVSGYSATSSGSTVTILGPNSAAGVLPVITTTPPIPNATVTFSGTANTGVSGITVNGIQIMGSGTSLYTSSSSLAAAVAAAVNLNGYSATSSGSVVTIYGPFSAAGFTPVVTRTGLATGTVTFSGTQSTIVTGITVNGTPIMSAATGAFTSATNLATSVASNININGFTATSSGGVVTITGPSAYTGQSAVVNETYGVVTTTINFSGSGATYITGVSVNGTTITSGSTNTYSSTSGLAAAVAANINQAGYSATASGSTVTVTGPTGALGYTPVVTRAAGPSSTITFSGSSNTSVTGITVNGTQIMGSPTGYTTSSTTMAANVAGAINQAGYSATASGSTVTVIGPGSATGFTPVVTKVGSATTTITFSGTQATRVNGITVNGTQIMSSAASLASNATTVAANVAAAISGAGYTATSSGGTVTVTGPASAAGFTPSINLVGTGTATITVTGSGSTSVSAVTVNGVNILSAGTSNSSNTSTVAARIANNINNATGSTGFTANASGNQVTITGPGASGVATFTKSGGMTLSSGTFASNGQMSTATGAFSASATMGAATTAFATGSAMSSSTSAFAGGGTMTASSGAFSANSTMSAATTSFPPAGTMTAAIQAFSPFIYTQVTSTSGPGGTDERTNFANWFSYYRIRMLMMKSGLGRAFVSIGNNYRVGFMTIYTTPSSSTTDPGYLAIGDFTTTQKQSWFNKVYSQTPGGSTPLKQALSTAARNIAGKVGPDPQQYSCQQNFILLSTDGYWNSGTPNGTQLNGSSSIGNQDNNLATAPRPQYDGGLSSSSNTLADVAWYYYNTDLRPSAGTCNTGVSGADVCQDNVPISGLDNAPWQHVTLFTLGLGTNGQLVYATNYLTGGSADYNAIVSGSKNWPSPTGDTLTTIDDLWHAAVNGHGQYFSAKNPDLLVSGLNTALAGVSARLAAGAAAATSNLEPVAGDNFAFVASYTTQEWTGDLQSRTIDLTTGNISTTANWSAQALLDTAATDVADTRTIFTFLNGAVTPFLSGSFSATQLANWFTPANAPQLSQYASWTALQQTTATPDTVVNYLRGQYGNEERGTNAAANQLYRVRTHVLGDIIDGKPVYMRLPPFNYTENNYLTFKTSSAVTSRPGTVYVGANDGMLHAFDSNTGVERWAYIPSFVLPNLKSLLDDTYANNHRYFVDGSPVVTDIWNGSAWKTILVGGLGAGGKGYFALDVTDPTNPNVLWEYSDTNLGYTLGNPVIGKLTDGTWVVAFTSGYNNVGDGVGRLYVLDAWTGTFKFSVSTGVGSASSPSGLNKIAAWVDNGLQDNTIQRIYGGDQFGNLWRFDINNQYPPSGQDALQLAFFQVGTYQQPITTQPELGLVNGKPVVYVGTGRYLGASDLTDLNQQSLYAIVDQLTATGLGNARTETTCPLVHQSLTVVNSTTRSTTTLPVDLSSKCGWYIDFNPTGGNTPGERINVDPKLQLGVLAVATNIPQNNVCTVGGTSFLYFFDYSTGSFVSTSTNNVAGQQIGNAIAVGINTYQLPSGQVVSTVTTSDDQHPTFGNPSNPSGVNIGRRVMWRELIN